ncbi:MAG: circularly permuted type 2 ATP-grasp protein [Chromatiales bacterium]
MKQKSTEISPDSARSLCTDYLPPGCHDEMCDPAGEVRPHWLYLMQALEQMGPVELRKRRDETWRQMRENDVTYNFYGERGGTRPWKLDLIPHLLESDTWASLESGLMQRAELLNLLLQDLYGPRKLVRQGVLPPELLHSHPGYLIPCINPDTAISNQLLFYAADLVRDRNGQTCVLSDRTQAPSGSGYALENRIVISRVLPSLFRDSHTHRLASYFRTVRHTLDRHAPSGDENEATIVLLSPGPANESYFEHAYLANYLGYTLVEGSDLVVRENRVWLKTLEGLRPVHVILRRMDDSYCDPVELREDSYLGVPGLMNAVRAGNVTVANPLGSGVLESPALMRYLPELSRLLLGQDLVLPSVETWWCGDPTELQHVLANLERLVIKPVHQSMGFRSRFGAELSTADRDALKARILANPLHYIAQERLPMSSLPVFDGDRLKPRHAVLRAFLVAEEHGYMVMPGGLTRVGSSDDQLIVTSQAGGISKDTWVLATEPEKQASLLGERQHAVYVPERNGAVPGRVADNMFWTGRYAERAEFVSRLLRLTLQFLETGEGAGTQAFDRLLKAVTTQTMTWPGFLKLPAGDSEAARNELCRVICDRSSPGSLMQTLSSFLRSARSIRDRLSSDTWRIINDIDDESNALYSIKPGNIIDALDEFDNLITALTAFSGLTLENITRGRSWRFLDMGRRIERALQISRLLESMLSTSRGIDDESLLRDSVLTVVDSLMTYRRRYREDAEIPLMLDLVICDENNPRSLAYQMTRIEEHVAGLPDKRDTGSRNDIERLALETATLVRLADINRLSTTSDQTGSRELLHEFLGVLAERLPALSNAITAAYFQAAELPHQLVRLRSGDES